MYKIAPARMNDFEIKIDGQLIPIQYVKALNIGTSISSAFIHGEALLTYECLRELGRQKGIYPGKPLEYYNFLNKEIEFIIKDDKLKTETEQAPGIKDYKTFKFIGMITSYAHSHQYKQNLFKITFERKNIAEALLDRYWKCYEKVTTLEVFKDFCDKHSIPLNTFPDDHLKKRSTFWENFAIPHNIPTFQYLLDELAKDALMVYPNLQTMGLNVASYHDILTLAEYHNKNNPQFTLSESDPTFKFTTDKLQWYDETITQSKQTDNRAPWKPQNVTPGNTFNTFSKTMHDSCYYSGLKKELWINEKDNKPIQNDLGLPPEQAFVFSGVELIDAQINPYPTGAYLKKNSDTPEIQFGNFTKKDRNFIMPRYWFFRSRESYIQEKAFIDFMCTIPGSIGGMGLLTVVPVSYFENEVNVDKNTKAEGDIWNSGAFLVTGLEISLSGNNIFANYKLSKPIKTSAIVDDSSAGSGKRTCGVGGNGTVGGNAGTGGTSGTGTSGSNGSVSSGDVQVATANAADEKGIWDYLMSQIGNAYGVAGMMGNWYAESNLVSKKAQVGFGQTDDGYTTKVDNGSYSNFVNDSIGYGLAQWTYHTRKQALLNKAKSSGKSIGDLNLQLEFAMQELQSSDYKKVLNKMKSATSVKEASDYILHNYEQPADQSSSAENKRAGYGQSYYNKYANSSS